MPDTMQAADEQEEETKPRCDTGSEHECVKASKDDCSVETMTVHSGYKKNANRLAISSLQENSAFTVCSC